jgi:Protein of unknown function (DUF2971)
MPDNRTIFHYCGTEAFLGIMNGLKLRLGPAEFMNDSTEFVWGRNLVQAKLNQYAGGTAWSAASNVIKKAIAIFPSLVSSPFLCCFSQDGDLLSQWRAYAQNGRGFAIGMRDSQLGVARISPLTSSNPDETIGLVDVIYDRNTQIAAIESVIGYNLTNWNNRNETRYIDEHAAKCAADLARLCSQVKNPAFSEEQEVRIVHVPTMVPDSTGRTRSYQSHLALGWRTSNSLILPFYELKISPEAIEVIVLGPLNRASRPHLELLLEQSGMGHVEIRVSAASYRD